MKTDKRPTVYRLTSVTTATDSANLYYIASPTATGLQHNHNERNITVTNKHGKPLAVFQY